MEEKIDEHIYLICALLFLYSGYRGGFELAKLVGLFFIGAWLLLTCVRQIPLIQNKERRKYLIAFCVPFFTGLWLNELRIVLT
jgi:hypothetical protein